MAKKISEERGRGIRERLALHGQGHLLGFFDELSVDEQESLLGEIEGLDLSVLDRLIERYVKGSPEVGLSGEIFPAAVYRAKAGAGQEEKYNEAYRVGQELIGQGRVAVCTVSGGMGTRLGFDGPKGCFPATPVRGKCLFAVFAESIRANQRRYGSEIMWFVMTSPANHQATLDAFEANGYFGLEKGNVFLFSQGMMPCFDQAGRILMSSKSSVAQSPNGHGGLIAALQDSGALAEMARRGIDCLSYFQVDNPLVYVLDPLFIGLHFLDGAQMSSRAVLKCDPMEKVGNFTSVNGRVHVIEYSDLPEETAWAKTDDGELLLRWGSIAVHMMNRSFLETFQGQGNELGWHRAVKKVSYVDENGRIVHPEEPNGVKLETFIFDALPMARKSIILELERLEQFGPIKNAVGVDSAQSSRALQIERAARWLEQAGVNVPRKGDGSAAVVLEISPLFALDGQELSQKRDQVPALRSGQSVYLG